MAFKVYTGAGGRRFVGEVGQGELVEKLSRDSGVAINSNARDQAAAVQLHSIGLHTQAEVIILHARGVLGFGPANPVNLSNHCRFNDGIAYRRFRRGARLPLRGRGVDTQNTPRFMAGAHRQGYAFFLTYPGSIGERQHTNEAESSWGKKAPARSRPTIHRGARGKHAKHLVWLLLYLNYLPWRSYPKKERSHFGKRAFNAVERFQRDHHLPADGVVGPVTWAQLGAAYRAKKKRKPPKPKPPPRHPSPIPHQLHRGPVNGPDVSEHQGDVDWRKVSVGGNEFAFVRVADGDHDDARFSKARVDAMRANRVIVGTYSYGRVASPANGERSGAAECDMYLKEARAAGWGRPGDLPFAYDFEEDNRQGALKAGRHLVQFVSRYHDRTGHWPFIYGPPAFLAAVVATLSPAGRKIVAHCPLWIAHVGPNGKPRTAPPTVPKPWKRYALWQFSWTGRQPGIAGNCDMNIFNGNFTALLRLTIRR